MTRTGIVTAALLLVAGTASAKSGIGVGAFVGTNTPVVQDDGTGSGTAFGVRVPVHLAAVFSLEPYFVSSSLSDTKVDFGGITYTRSGFKTTGFGANLALANLVRGGAFKFFPFGGIGSYTLKRGLDPNVTETTYTGGLGFAILVHHDVGIHLRGEGVMVKEGDASRKFGSLTFGLSYAVSGE